MRKPTGPLKRGWTTGACATAASKAAYVALLTGRFEDPVEIDLPNGNSVAFSLTREELSERGAMAAVVKDAGDDPDVTHGALVMAMVRNGPPGSGINFKAGEGVGTVTKSGLALAVGEPAINPAPRQMMTDAISSVASAQGVTADVEVELAIPGGETLAAKTMNGRLGIVGGLSILGTTGVVVPYSCAAWIASIRQAVDVARAGGIDHMGAATGNASEQAVCREFGFPPERVIEMGDFAGGLLKYLRRHPLPRLTVAGGFAKMSKLAAGHLDLHSGRSAIDIDFLADLVGDDGIRDANTAAEALSITGPDLADKVAQLARSNAQDVCGSATLVDVLVTDRTGQIVGRADG